MSPIKTNQACDWLRMVVVCVLPGAILTAPQEAVAQYRIISRGPVPVNPFGSLAISPTTVPPPAANLFRVWDVREFTNCRIPFVIDPAGTADIPNFPIIGPLENFPVVFAALEWERVKPAVVGFRGPAAAAGLLPIPPTGGGALLTPAFDGHNHVKWLGGAGWLWGAGTIGLTGIWTDANGWIQEADIVLNDDWFWTLGLQITPRRIVDTTTVVVHEFGHFLGIHHSVTPMRLFGLGGPIMQPAAQRFGFGPLLKDTPTAEDAQALNFLYTPDLGDAPDPWRGVFNEYQTVIRNAGAGRMLNGIALDTFADGPTHLFGYSSANNPHWFERLGFNGPFGNPTGECNPNLVNRDRFDDGVGMPVPLVRGAVNPVVVTITYANPPPAGRYAAGNPARRMYLNGYMDFNNDCVFDVADWVIWWEGTNLVTVASSGNLAGAVFGAGAITLTFNVAVPPGAPDSFYCRFRLDYGEDEGLIAAWKGPADLAPAEGAALFGEVEDYPCLTDGAFTCCLLEGYCVESVTEGGCLDVGGIPQPPGLTCAEIECPQPSLVACCFGDGICGDLTEGECMGQGGESLGSDTACAAPEACCMLDGTCLFTDPACCLAQDGMPLGTGTVCTETQACCITEVGESFTFCRDLDPLCCVEQGGTPLGDGSNCLGDADFNGHDDACEGVPTGTCCLGGGVCVKGTETVCTMIEGAYGGDGTVCLGDGNGDDVDDACEGLGACCFPDGSCRADTTADCVNAGGTPLGIESVCLGDGNDNGIDDACDDAVTGACCMQEGFEEGSCTETSPVVCASIGGRYVGDGTTCLGDHNGDGLDDACEGEPIPMLPEWGLILLGLLMLIAGTIVFGRPRPAQGIE